MKAVKNKREVNIMKNTKMSARIFAGVMAALMFFGVAATVLGVLLT